MSQPTPLPSSPPITYTGVLRDYLARPDEHTLEQAYELGRAALNAGLGVFDVIRLHHQALAEGVVPASEPRYVAALETFLLEVLSPFEATHRGFRTALERMEQMNRELNVRNEELASGNAQLKELSAQVLSAQEEERKRISRELHDEIGQALTAVNVTVAMLKRQAGDNVRFQREVANAEQLIAQSMETVHCFARELRPAALDHLGVLAALRAHIAAFSRRTGLHIEINPHADLAKVHGQYAEVVFRVAQEALNNVFKHAQATRVVFGFSSDATSLTMEIADNGKAFSVDEKLGSKKTGRLGLLGMQERVRLVGGRFAVESVAGKGTKLSARIPLPRDIEKDAEGKLSTINHEENIRIAS